MACGCLTSWNRLCGKFHTCLGNLFEKWGRFVYKRPALVLVVSLVTSFALMAGFLKYSVYGQAERLFYPQNSFVFKSLDRVKDSFNYYIQNEEFILIRNDGRNILNSETFKMAHKLHKDILQIKGFDSYCLEQPRTNSCVSINPFDGIFHQDNFQNVSQTLFKALTSDSTIMGNGLSPKRNFPQMFGKFNTDITQQKLDSNVIRISYPVHFSQTRTKYEQNSKIEKSIIDYLKSKEKELSLEGISLAYNTVRGLDDSISQNTKDNVSLIGASIFSMILFCTLGMINLQAKIKSHILVSLAGILAVLFGIGAGFGLGLLIGQPYVGFIGVLPFLVLGIGIDDMFIIMHHLDRVPMEIKGPDRLGMALKHAGLSILMTTLTDLVAFMVGAVSMFPAVKIFCIFAFLSILFAFLMILTFFLALVSYDIRRIGANRWDCLPCFHGDEKSEELMLKKENKDTCFSKVMKAYGNFLMNKFVKIGVVIFAAILLIMGIYGTIHTSLDFDYKVSGSAKSSYVNWLQTLESNFPFGVFQMDVVLDDPNVNYTDPKIQQIFKTLDTFPVSKVPELNTSLTVNWMTAYMQWSEAQSLSISGDSFYKNLPTFLNQFKDFRIDIVQDTETGRISASRIHFFTKDRWSLVFRRDALVNLREACDSLPIPLYPVSFTFIYVSHLIVIIKATLTNVAICAAVILSITLPFVVNPKVSLIHFLTFISFLIELLGMMYLWDLSLNSITMLVLVMAVGFAVDYSCHIVHAYLVSKETGPDEQMKDAISNIGSSILKGALSTLIGILVLSISSSKLFRLFFKMVFSIILLGLIHGMIILPVILTWFVKNTPSYENQTAEKEFLRNGDGRESKKQLLKENGQNGGIHMNGGHNGGVVQV
ncbi:patched domain-containing protein 3-like [Clytia hemisphaerica]|uniref:SSD domain-containing protein n=1 Tax=Clytia hemisphaerica TaxID=252671 RepID=A0A7M5UKS7_9CNID